MTEHEEQARELLADVYEAEGASPHLVATIRSGFTASFNGPLEYAFRAIEKALALDADRRASKKLNAFVSAALTPSLPSSGVSEELAAAIEQSRSRNGDYLFYGPPDALLVKAKALIDQRAAQLAEMRDALEPFAQHEAWQEGPDNAVADLEGHSLTVGYFRKAKAALSEPDKAGPAA